jgi:hypothetical protein
LIKPLQEMLVSHDPDSQICESADNTVDGKLSWEIGSGDYADSFKRVFTLVSCELNLICWMDIADI